MTHQSRRFREAMGGAINVAMKLLLSEKHLYQSVEVGLGPVSAVLTQIRGEIRRSGPNLSSAPLDLPADIEEMKRSSTSCVNVPWAMDGCDIRGAFPDLVFFALPHINTPCATCKSRPPFNPIGALSSCFMLPEHHRDQWYSLAYQCQQCHGIPVRFLVRREGLKLTLVGRDPLEVIPSPNALPDKVSKFYGQAVVAHHAGYTLAGIFLLRTFIEQYWRKCVPRVHALIREQPRATGEEQGKAYQDTLPVLFSDQFPSLLDIYGKLSEAMHEAKADDELCEDCRAKIVEHFEARRLFKL